MFNWIRAKSFFLTTAREYRPLTTPRQCWEELRMVDSVRNDYMLVRIEPSFRDERSVPKEIDRLILSTRLKQYSLYPITEWPCRVYVIRIVDESILQTAQFTREQVEIIAWGTVFQTRKQAQNYASGGNQ
jgi:hypothetical protein